MNEVTRILSAVEHGDPHAAEQLLPLVYNELRHLAAARMAREAPGQTLQPTALVHEAYLRLVDADEAQHWDSRADFFAAAAEAMRRILIDRARHNGRLKRGGDRKRQPLTYQPAPSDDEQLLALDEALTRLKEEEPLAAKVAELHHFGGLGYREIATVLGITAYRARQLGTYARAWLSDAIGPT
jgi:RNA polymerase sigma factor (TIGR02999 family)